MLKWLVQNGFPVNEDVCSIVAESNLEMLQWLRENECPWDESLCCGMHSRET